MINNTAFSLDDSLFLLISIFVWRYPLILQRLTAKKGNSLSVKRERYHGKKGNGLSVKRERFVGRKGSGLSVLQRATGGEIPVLCVLAFATEFLSVFLPIAIC